MSEERVEPYEVQTCQLVAEERVEPYQVQTCRYVAEERVEPYQVRTCEMVAEQRVETIPVTTCSYVAEERVEPYEVQTCQLVAEERVEPYQVTTCSYAAEERVEMRTRADLPHGRRDGVRARFRSASPEQVPVTVNRVVARQVAAHRGRAAVHDGPRRHSDLPDVPVSLTAEVIPGGAPPRGGRRLFFVEGGQVLSNRGSGPGRSPSRGQNSARVVAIHRTRNDHPSRACNVFRGPKSSRSPPVLARQRRELAASRPAAGPTPRPARRRCREGGQDDPPIPHQEAGAEWPGDPEHGVMMARDQAIRPASSR